MQMLALIIVLRPYTVSTKKSKTTFCPEAIPADLYVIAAHRLGFGLRLRSEIFLSYPVSLTFIPCMNDCLFTPA